MKSKLFYAVILANLIVLAREAGAAVPIVEAATDVLISARTSSQAVTRKEAPRLGGVEAAPYVGVVRFAIQPGAKYTLLEIYSAEPGHRMVLTGYYPLSQDKRPIKGKDGVRTDESTKTASKTGKWGYRSNFSVDPKSNGRFLYYVYLSETPALGFQVQLSSRQLPADEVKNNNDSPHSGAKGYFWGEPDMGEVFAEVLPDEPERKSNGKDSVTGTKPPMPPTGGTKGTNGTRPDPDSRVAGQMTIKVESRKVKSGSVVSIPVQLLDGKDVANLNVTIEYEARGAKSTQHPEAGPIYKTLNVVLFEGNHGEAGIIRFGHATTDRLDGSGILTMLSFQVTGAPGTVIPLVVKVTTANDSTGRPLAIATINGEIRIEDPENTTKGDLDGDGIVTIADAKSALKMSVKLIPEDLICDVDGDGKVTSNDARILLARATGASAR